MTEAVRTWDDFQDAVRTVCHGSVPGDVLFRGAVRSDFDLLPSFARVADTDPMGSRPVLYRLEFEAYRQFRREARHFLDANLYAELRDEDNPILWLTIMQHYGAPTRLLDWTKSPYAALYFACEREPKSDGVVWFWRTGAVDHAQKEEATQEYRDFETAIKGNDGEISQAVLFNPDRDESLPFISPLVSEVTTRRLTAQSGAFSITNSPNSDHGTVIEEVLKRTAHPQPERVFGNFTINFEAKIHLMSELRNAGVTGLSLFPDSEGLARLVREKTQWISTPYGLPRSEWPL